MEIRSAMALFVSCLLSTGVFAECATNSEGQEFCEGETVFTHYLDKAEILDFHTSDLTEVMVLEGQDKGRKQFFETKLLYKGEGCILEFCIGTLVRREEQDNFSRNVIGINKVYNNVLYENSRGERYAVQPNRLIAKDGVIPQRPVPAPGPVVSGWTNTDSTSGDGSAKSSASVTSENSGTTLILSCKAPASDMTLNIKLSDILYRAAKYSVDTLGEKLVVEMIIDSETFELTGWELSENNMIVQLDTLYPEEVTKLRKGSSLDIVLRTTDKSAVSLLEETFSLKGSGKAIKSAQDSCASDDTKY
ncbi:MAG: hypothetical protein K9K67_15965 [Bacteriovoracaceae bacterium]|nr:hypothetical protein [Bacteriovoracaceae bacterium]